MRNLLKALAVAVSALALSSAAGAASYKVVAVSGGGVIKGKVSAGSAKPKTQTFTISKDPQVCGTGTRVVPLVRENGGALLDAVVYLAKVKKGKAFPKGLDSLTINQQKCAFHPFFSVMANGGTIEARNSDNTLHNIHTYELIRRARRTVFNVSQPKKGDVFKKKVKLRRGPAIKIECDAHDFMHGFIFVAKNPYFAVVNDKGEFEIKDVPPGKYTIKVWHGTLGVKKAKVTVKGGAAATVNFTY